MSDTSIDPAETVDPHADKYNDPRAKITRRGILLALAVLAFAVLGAAASIYGRRTRLGQTSRFWGSETITALQLGERMQLLPVRGPDFPPVELTATPGLGHLRRSLLDERNFNWSTESDVGVLEKSADTEDEFCVMLRLTDPTAHRIGIVEIQLDLTSGWAGPSDQSRSVQVADRKRTGLRSFLVTIMNKEKKRYDMRD